MSSTTLQHAFDLAVGHHRAGQLKEAENLYRQILAQVPDHPESLHLLGVVAHQTGRKDLSVQLIRTAIARQPQWAEAHYNLGNALRDLKQWDTARAAYQKAISINPGYAAAYNNLGNTLRDLGEMDQALAAYRRAAHLQPGYAEALYNVGNALKERRDLDDAITAFDQAIKIRPGYFQAHNNLGETYRDQRKPVQAIACFERVLALQPTHAGACNNLALAFADQGKLDEAVTACRRAIALNPQFARAFNNLGNLLKDQGLLDEALAGYRRAILLEPSNPQFASNLIYFLEFHPAFDARSIAVEQQQWNTRHSQPLAAHVTPHESRVNRRLRIGYVSPDFYDHAQSFFTVPLLANHDHQEVEIFCYSSVKRPDAITQQIASYADHWRDVHLLDDAAVDRLIRADGIDVLVDFTMHMAGNRLGVFARKPAPVQVTWLAYPASTGLTAIDYRLSDPYLDPPEIDESLYSEKTIRLPDSFWCYDPLSGREIPVNTLPAAEPGVVTFGCLNNFCKINIGVLNAWAQVMREVHNSRLLLLAPIGSHRQHALDLLQHQGIDSSRIEFVPHQSRADYLKTYHRIDLGLDTFPYNGHTTSLDSLWMGVPVVTLVGNRPVSRAGWCQLSNLGLTQLAGDTPEQFVSIAVSLAKDLTRLSTLRSTLRERIEKSPLMDGKRFARNVEVAFGRMFATQRFITLP